MRLKVFITAPDIDLSQTPCQFLLQKTGYFVGADPDGVPWFEDRLRVAGADDDGERRPAPRYVHIKAGAFQETDLFGER